LSQNISRLEAANLQRQYFKRCSTEPRRSAWETLVNHLTVKTDRLEYLSSLHRETTHVAT